MENAQGGACAVLLNLAVVDANRHYMVQAEGFRLVQDRFRVKSLGFRVRNDGLRFFSDFGGSGFEIPCSGLLWFKFV